jgi:thiol-disulfide isomerase/thioredoxin
MLAGLVLAARLVLAAVFAVAGGAKLADRAGTRRAVVDFGAPEGLAVPLALLLPAAELGIAGLLLPATTAVAGSAGALALLALFSGAIGYNLARGRAPDCHCFGQLHSAPAGRETLARNGVLLGIAAFALAGGLARPDRSAAAWIVRLDGAELVALAVGVASAALLVAGVLAFVTILRSYGRVLIRLERVEAALTEHGLTVEEEEPPPEVGLEPGTQAPAFAELDELLAPGVPLLLLFTSPHCGPCKALIPEAAAWQREHPDVLTVAFASDGEPDDVRAEAEEFELEHVLVDADGRLYGAYRASGTPSAVLVAADGMIASWVAGGREWIERLVESTLAAPAEESGLPVGAEVPHLELPSLEGGPVALDSLRGSDTLLLFWNPSCGFCREMHEDLLAWESSPNGGPQLVVVSTGDAESTRAERFRSRVLLDREYAAASAFGAGGTPMAVLLDAEGRVASPIAAGGEAVLALAGAGVTR